MGRKPLEMQTVPAAVAANGDLSEARQAAVEQGLALYHQVAEERDALQKEADRLRSDIAGYKVALEAKDSILADLESRILTMQMVRDEAVAHRAKWEALFTSVQAQLRAFQVPAAPIIKHREEEPNALATE